MKGIVFAILFLLCGGLSSLERRPRPQPMKVSVIVPCHSSHPHFLENLLLQYLKQTSIPHEVVISLSQIDRVDPVEIAKIQNRRWPFILKLITHPDQLCASANRNAACRESSGDLLIMQDADDIPHRQRVEVIKEF